jgi:hypothetical protein
MEQVTECFTVWKRDKVHELGKKGMPSLNKIFFHFPTQYNAMVWVLLVLDSLL